MNTDWLKYNFECTKWLKHKVECIDNLKEEQRNRFTVEELDLIKERIEQGEELWFFRSEDDSWQSLSGREGYAVLKDEKPVLSFITAMN